MSKNTSKHTDYTKDEIKIYLYNLKENIKRGRFYVCATDKNKKNVDFIYKYNLRPFKIKKMLMELEVADFCYTADNYNDPREKLYIFCKEYELNNWGTIEKVEVYIKVVIKKDNNSVIISFHKPEKKIKRLFL